MIEKSIFGPNSTGALAFPRMIGLISGWLKIYDSVLNAMYAVAIHVILLVEDQPNHLKTISSRNTQGRALVDHFVHVTKITGNILKLGLDLFLSQLTLTPWFA